MLCAEAPPSVTTATLPPIPNAPVLDTIHATTCTTFNDYGTTLPTWEQDLLCPNLCDRNAFDPRPYFICASAALGQIGKAMTSRKIAVHPYTILSLATSTSLAPAPDR
jgi:hypothetical protein